MNKIAGNNLENITEEMDEEDTIFAAIGMLVAWSPFAVL
jgi:hypothetical protein